nr:hypothetical protein [uncultured Draconibacterium sp.]
MEINDKNLKFLDFILNELAKEYPDGSVLYFLSMKYEDKTGIKFDKLELDSFFNLYKGKYFLSVQNSEYVIIHPDYINIINSYGSLSSAFNRNHKLKTKRKISNIITQYVLPLILLATSIYFGISADINKGKINELNREKIEKDSIINDLKFQLNNSDTLKIE